MKPLPTSFHTPDSLRKPAFRLALVTIIQFAEGLSDRQAADAVRGRIDVKYALSLDLSDPGFDASVLSEFRARLIAGHAEEQLLTAMLTLFKERGWRHPRVANSAPIRPMCWPRFEPSIDWDDGEKSCAIRSIAWQLWRLSGCVSIVSLSGWIVRANAWARSAFL